MHPQHLADVRTKAACCVDANVAEAVDFSGSRKSQHVRLREEGLWG